MIQIVEGHFCAQEYIKKMRNPEVGAIITYLGVARKSSARGEEVISIRFSPDEMMRNKLEEIEGKAKDKFDIADVVIVHRIGYIKVSERILLVAVSSSHRDAAFKSCAYIIDEIKNLHSSWMEEITKTVPDTT